MPQSRQIAAALLAAALAAAAPAHAQTADPLQMSGRIVGGALHLDWTPRRAGQAQVYRRELGQTGPDSWQQITPRSVQAGGMVDALPPGKAWEYQVRLTPVRTGPKSRPEVGNWTAGTDVPARLDEGTALLIADETLAGDLAPALKRFAQDLTGAGWRVERHDAPRHDDADAAANLDRAAALRDWIVGRYRANGGQRTAVILVGHLPIVHTGRVRPDGHDFHAVPTDLYYADPDGVWPRTQGPDGAPQLFPSTLPGPVRMAVGRIDMAKMGPDYGTERELLQVYLDRDHRWRMGGMGDPRIAYAQSEHLQVERAALANIVGAGGVRPGGHEAPPAGGPYLFGLDFGPWNGNDYARLPPSPAVFALNFGSGKHRFDGGNNAMTALLAQKGNVLAVGWGGRPAWQLHGMALGESIGEAQLRTAGNGSPARGMGSRDYPATGNYDWVGAPWIELLGDPTLRPFPMPPVNDLRASRAEGGVRLDWTPPKGAEGAVVLRAAAPQGPWQPLFDGRPVAPGIVDTRPGGGWYMVRASGLAKVNAGSLHRLAQGMVIEAGAAEPVAPPVRRPDARPPG